MKFGNLERYDYENRSFIELEVILCVVLVRDICWEIKRYRGWLLGLPGIPYFMINYTAQLTIPLYVKNKSRCREETSLMELKKKTTIANVPKVKSKQANGSKIKLFLSHEYLLFIDYLSISDCLLAIIL